MAPWLRSALCCLVLPQCFLTGMLPLPGKRASFTARLGRAGLLALGLSDKPKASKCLASYHSLSRSSPICASWKQRCAGQFYQVASWPFCHSHFLVSCDMPLKVRHVERFLLPMMLVSQYHNRFLWYPVWEPLVWVFKCKPQHRDAAERLRQSKSGNFCEHQRASASSNCFPFFPHYDTGKPKTWDK